MELMYFMTESQHAEFKREIDKIISMSKDKSPQAWIDSLLLEARLKDLEYQCYEAGSYPAV